MYFLRLSCLQLVTAQSCEATSISFSNYDRSFKKRFVGVFTVLLFVLDQNPHILRRRSLVREWHYLKVKVVEPDVLNTADWSNTLQHFTNLLLIMGDILLVCNDSRQ